VLMAFELTLSASCANWELVLVFMTGIITFQKYNGR